jgi:hypothetical protein
MEVGPLALGCLPTTTDESAGNNNDKSNCHDDPNQHEYPDGRASLGQFRAAVLTASSRGNQVRGPWVPRP